MKYYLPCALSRMTQGFGGSQAVYAPLKGHPAHDFAFDWNEEVPFIANSYVYSKLNENNKDPEKYTATCTIVENEFGVDEIIYGHPNLMPVEIGRTYSVGETAALAGNKGMVFSFGRRITKEEKLAGSTAGTHLHLQRRPCIKVTKKTKGKKYLRDAKGDFKKDGFYYEIKNYNNGYNGCEPIEYNGKVAKKMPHGTLVSYEEAVSFLKRDLKEPVLSMALWVLKQKYGR